MSGFYYEKDEHGIVTVTMDMEGPVNAMNAQYRALMADTIQSLEQETGLTGVVITSAKNTFFAGGDLQELLNAQRGNEAESLTILENSKSELRRLEKLQVPVVAAINGAALGGGYEICLACNYRIAWDSPKVLVGLPEVTLGLIPGGGGVVRSVHRWGAEKALPFLINGDRFIASTALAMGLVDELADSRENLVARAKEWIQENPDAWQQPWDKPGHRIPGGDARDSEVRQFLHGATAALYKKTRGLLPAPERILAVAAEALSLDIDTALRVESRALVYLATTAVAKNMITAGFFQANEVNSGSRRPVGVEKAIVRKVGVLGAGMMGQGIVCAAVDAGIPTVLKDVSIEVAEQGRDYCQRYLENQMQRGRIDRQEKERRLALIRIASDNDSFEDCDLVIEAVFENFSLKSQVIRELEPSLASHAVLASNTSALPITELAKASERPGKIVGIHFFSPVEKMPLVEIICGEKTSPETLALAFDFAKQIRKTPIVVNDSLGFFTSRTFATYLDEGCRLLQDGMSPVAIDNLGMQVGMPVGPLAVYDEVSLELTRKGAVTQREMGIVNTKSDYSASTNIAEMMIEKYGRGGRRHGGGFYDYAEDGSKRIWPQLYKLFYRKEHNVPSQDAKDRLLFRQVIEALKCLEEGVVQSVAEANVGSLLGIGAPTWTGGFIQVVNTYGPAAFVARSRELASRYGKRFSPPTVLLEAVENGQVFK